MKFLADVNIDRRIINALRADGHEVLWVAEKNRELGDIALLRQESVPMYHPGAPEYN